jgi:hypothetical protein
MLVLVTEKIYELYLEMGLGTMINILSFMKIGAGVQALLSLASEI